jgi:hypothetical protein
MGELSNLTGYPVPLIFRNIRGDNKTEKLYLNRLGPM